MWESIFSYWFAKSSDCSVDSPIGYYIKAPIHELGAALPQLEGLEKQCQNFDDKYGKAKINYIMEVLETDEEIFCPTSISILSIDTMFAIIKFSKVYEYEYQQQSANKYKLSLII